MATVYVLHEEGNTDFHSDVLSVHRTRKGAEQAKRDAEDAACAEGQVVEDHDDGECEDCVAHGGNDGEWTRSYKVFELELEA